MVASETPTTDNRDIAPDPTHHYRVLAVPAFSANSDDVLIRDEQGQPYLLAQDTLVPTPLDQSDVDALGMFFEASLDFSWHTEPELRQMFYGTDRPVATNP
jgi:hypothetical protein